MASRGVIYYTDCKIQDPIKSVVQKYIKASGLPITSCSLNEPIDFGTNVVFWGKRGYVTYVRQILEALSKSKEDYVFFCEQDVLYPKSHFDFTPPKDNIFYYDENVWRWLYGSDKAISYDRLISLSGLCVNTKFAIDHYMGRLVAIVDHGLDKFASHEPAQARAWGYEPGTKKKTRGGFSDDDFELWCADDPMVDIRHKGTFSPIKVSLDKFSHAPEGWKEIPIEMVPHWGDRLMELFDL